MLGDIVSQLSNLGFEKHVIDAEVLEDVISDGPRNPVLAQIVSWLSDELQFFLKLESHVNPVSGSEDGDVSAFHVELSSLLKELGCPYSALTCGNIAERFSSEENLKHLLIYLCSEVQAARMSYEKIPETEKTITVELTESPTAHDLKEALIALGFGKPPDHITAEMLFTEIEKKVRSISGKLEPKDFIGKHIINASLSEKQWYQLERLKAELDDEYMTRREMLLTRLDVTVQSFQWSDRLKPKSNEIMKIYDLRKSQLPLQPDVHLSDILAANEDLLIVEKTCAASLRQHTLSSVNRVLIGAVPDRGGRPNEQKPPPPEVPSWQKNDTRSQPSFSSTGHSSQRSNVSGAMPKGASNNYHPNHDSYNKTAPDSSSYRGSRPQSFSQNHSRSYQQAGPRPDTQSSPNDHHRPEKVRYGQTHEFRSPREQPTHYISPLNPTAPVFNPYPFAEIRYVNDGTIGFGGYAVAAGADFQQYGMPQFVQEEHILHAPHQAPYNMPSGNRGRGNRRGGGRGPGRGGYNRY